MHIVNECFRSINDIEAKAERNSRKSPFYKMIYKDLISDSLTEVKKMYSYFNIKFTEDTERHLVKYLENDPKKTKYGTFKYSMSEFGISEERLKREFVVYSNFMSKFTDDVI